MNTLSEQQPAIRLDGIGKAFPIYQSRLDQLIALMFGHRWRERDAFMAVNGIDLQIEAGETVGLLGVNGAGKSTLLHLIAGTHVPTLGQVQVNGTIAALLELGAGFNISLTGRQNAEFHCRINGADPGKVPAIVDRIEEFADIGGFFDRPMKLYSSGMYMRVAFAAAIMVDPDILIVDEALSVGDARFQLKCFGRFRELQNAGKTILFVTHSAELVPRYCSRAIVLEAGNIAFDGSPREAVEFYTERMFADGRTEAEKTQARIRTHGRNDRGEPKTDTEPEPSTDVARRPRRQESWVADCRDQLSLVSDGEDRLLTRPYYNAGERRHGQRDAEIVDVVLMAPEGPAAMPFASGSRITVAVQLRANKDLPDLGIGVNLLANDGLRIFGTAVPMEHAERLSLNTGEQGVMALAIDLPLQPGSFFLDLSVFTETDGTYLAYDVRHTSVELLVSAERSFGGLVDLNPQFGKPIRL